MKVLAVEVEELLRYVRVGKDVLWLKEIAVQIEQGKSGHVFTAAAIVTKARRCMFGKHSFYDP